MKIKLSKKLILIIILAGVLILLAVLIYLWPIIKPIKEKPIEEALSEEEKIIKEQLEELQGLPNPLTEENIQEQLKELEKEPPVLSEEEIKKQLEELNK